MLVYGHRSFANLYIEQDTLNIQLIYRRKTLRARAIKSGILTPKGQRDSH